MEVLAIVIPVASVIICLVFFSKADNRLRNLEKDVSDLFTDSFLVKDVLSDINKRSLDAYNKKLTDHYREKIRELDHYLYCSRVDYADLKKRYEELKMATKDGHKQNSPS